MPPTDPTAAEVWTVGRIIEWTTQHLRKHGSETPRLDAEILLAHARGCPRIQLYVDYGEPLTDSQRAVMRDLVRRRSQSEPVAYLVGHREFFSLEFRVTPDTLIPRPETETLVLELISEARKRDASANEQPASGPDGDAALAPADAAAASTSETAKVRPLALLDVGTGSGCIAVAAAVNLPSAQVTAIDISPMALAVARDNAARHAVENRITFLEGDLLAPLAESDRFDVIASNPPYVAQVEIDSLAADVRLHEPHLALGAGEQGLDLIARLIEGAAAHLVSDGLLLIEISPEQEASVVELVSRQGAFEPARALRDAAGLPRVIAARRLALAESPAPRLAGAP